MRMLKRYWWVAALLLAAAVAYRYWPTRVPPNLATERRGPIGYGHGSPPYRGGSVQSEAYQLRKVQVGSLYGGGLKKPCCTACGSGGGCTI